MLANRNRAKEDLRWIIGGKRALNPADAEAWEKHMRLERELLTQRRDGKLAKAIGKALAGESPQDLEQMAREDRGKAEEGLVFLVWGGLQAHRQAYPREPSGETGGGEGAGQLAHGTLAELATNKRARCRRTGCSEQRGVRSSKA